MKRDGHDPWIIIEGLLDTVAMMGIEVDVEYLRLTGLLYMSNSNGDVIVDTEARCTCGPRMMPPACWMKNV